MANTSVKFQAGDGSRVWQPDIVTWIAYFLSANDICALRLVAKATSQQFANHKTMRLSLPSPPHIFKQYWGRPESFRGYTRKQREKLLCLTTASGSIANLEVALANAGLVARDSELLDAAAEAGQLEVCKMLRARGFPLGDHSLAAAARGGHRHVCEWLLASGCPFGAAAVCAAARGGQGAAAVCAAARGGHKGLMHWLMTHQVIHPTGVGSLLRAAAEGLSLEAFQQLMQQLLTGQQQGGGVGQQQQPEEVLSQHQQGSILTAAASSSTPDWQAKVELLEGLGYPRTLWACYVAITCSPDEEAVSRLQWLRSRGYILDATAAAYAAVSRGKLAALRFLMEQAGVRLTHRASYTAARNGHLAVLQHLRASDLLCEPQLVAQLAAEEGHLSVVVWAVEALGVMPGNANDLLSLAAWSGSVELLTWLHELQERGWTWGPSAIPNAARSGCEEAVEWLLEQGCPFPVDGAAYTSAAYNGDLAMVRCLHRLGCPWGPPGDVLVYCIRHTAPAPALRCLVELGCPVDWDVAVRAAEARDPGEYRTAVLAWLGEERLRRSSANV